jgi:predicted P-loop ATPase
MKDANSQAANKPTPADDMAVAKEFLTLLDPNTEKFAFQFISDGADRRRSNIRFLTLEEAWAVVEAQNTPTHRIGVFMLPNTPQPRVLLAAADNEEQIDRAHAAITACGATVDMIVNDNGRLRLCYICPDIPPEQLVTLQKHLSAKLGTDPTAIDLPYLRLPGTLNLENPAAPRLVQLLRNGASANWKVADLFNKLDKLSTSKQSTTAAKEQPLSMLAAALHYATERGWDVFPAPPGKKKSYKSAEYSGGAKWGKTRDPKQIRRDFTHWKDANVGIPTGKDNGIWGIEADTLKGHNVDGIAELRKLEAKHGPLPVTLMAESPSGSRHRLFNWPKGVEIRNSTSAIAPGVDVRGEGGMVIAPPSMRADGVYRWLNDAPIADAPQWLIDAAVAASSKGNGKDSGTQSPPRLEIAEAFKGLPLKNLGEGIEPRTASIEQIRAAFAVIPNNDTNPGNNTNWHEWNTRGMAIYRATAGSDDGFAIFDAWSRKSKKYYNKQKTIERWEDYKGCPPTIITFGSIHHWANQAAPGWEELVGLPFEQATKIAALIPLSTSEYETKRKTAAKELGMRIGQLDKIVEHMRRSARDSQPEPAAALLNLGAATGAIFRDYNKGRPKSSLANAVIAIRALEIGVCYDLFHHEIKVTYKGEAKTIREGLLTDDTISAIRSLINNTYKIDCGDNFTLAAIKEIAFSNAYDPVLDLLDECQGKWDGVKRLDTWTTVYLGCEDTPLHRAIGWLTLVAACRRARVPGCKFDQITVLEGPEGTNKSTAIRIIAGDDNFSDASIIGADAKEVQEQLDGVWMHENADLDGMRRAEVTKVKNFARRQVDRARPAYGRVREDHLRRSIEWGTTNEEVYLLSQTGNRSFWQLKTGKIDIVALKRDREQLLGEAATYEAAGKSVVLDEGLRPAARIAQEQRRVTDPWEDVLVNYFNNKPSAQGVIRTSGDGYERVASADVLKLMLDIPYAQQISTHGQRLAQAMQRIGWERTPSGRVQINGRAVRGYRRWSAASPRPHIAGEDDNLQPHDSGKTPRRRAQAAAPNHKGSRAQSAAPEQGNDETPAFRERFYVVSVKSEMTPICVNCGQSGNVKRIKPVGRPGVKTETLHEGACAEEWFAKTL